MTLTPRDLLIILTIALGSFVGTSAMSSVKIATPLIGHDFGATPGAGLVDAERVPARSCRIQRHHREACRRPRLTPALDRAGYLAVFLFATARRPIQSVEGLAEDAGF